MGKLVMNCDRIRFESGAACLLVHHVGKDTTKGARGHSRLRAANDTEIEIIRDETSGAVTAFDIGGGSTELGWLHLRSGRYSSRSNVAI
jgi:hypothetical protein